MDQYPKLSTAAILLIAAACLGALAAYGKMSDLLRTIIVACAAILGFLGIVSLLDWIVARVADHIRSIEAAKAYSAVMVANALRGLSQTQTEIIAKYGAVQAVGILGEHQIFWDIQTPGGKIPWECMADFVLQSRQTDPYLWPVSKHDVFSREPYRWQDYRDAGYGSTEDMCQRITDFFKHRNWAEDAAGPYSAKLLVPLVEIRDTLGVEEA